MPNHPEIPWEAVEALAEALWNEREFRDPTGDEPEGWCPPGHDVHQTPPKEPFLWEQMTREGKFEGDQAEYRVDARAALNAAAPAIRSQERQRVREATATSVHELASTIGRARVHLDAGRPALAKRELNGAAEAMGWLRTALDTLEDSDAAADVPQNACDSLRSGLLKEIKQEQEVAVRWRAAAPPNATAPLNEVRAQEAEERADRLAALLEGASS